MNSQFASVTHRHSKNRIITKKNFTSSLLGATSPFVHTTIFPAISEAWIKYVKITVFWDVLPPYSHYKMPPSTLKMEAADSSET